MTDQRSRAERTAALLRRAEHADPETRASLHEEVVELNMPVAAQVAARYRGRGLPSEDLEQVAYLALVKSVSRFRTSEGRELLSYAVPTIRGEVQRQFRDHGWTIRPRRTVQDAQRAIRRAEGELWQQLGRAPRPSEIATHLELDLDLVIEALAANGCFSPTSLDTLLEDDGTTLGASLGSTETGYERVDARLTLRPLLARLTERERRMLEMRFVHQTTQAAIGEALGITQMQVSRLLSALMARLRDELLDPCAEEPVIDSVA